MLIWKTIGGNSLAWKKVLKKVNNPIDKTQNSEINFSFFEILKSKKSNNNMIKANIIWKKIKFFE